MKIDRPGFEVLDCRFDRAGFGVAGPEADPGARSFAVDFAGGAGLSSKGRGLLSDLISDGDLGGVLGVGRFFFSGMPAEIIPSVGGRDQLASCIVIQYRTHEATATSKNRRSEDPKVVGSRPPPRASRVGELESDRYKHLAINCCLYLALSGSPHAGRRPATADAAVTCPAGAGAPAGIERKKHAGGTPAIGRRPSKTMIPKRKHHMPSRVLAFQGSLFRSTAQRAVPPGSA